MRESATFTISLPPAMAKEVQRVMKVEHRTRSELVREALRIYLSVRLMPAEMPTPSEARAYRRGMAAYNRGDVVVFRAGEPLAAATVNRTIKTVRPGRDRHVLGNDGRTVADRKRKKV
jgi:predicted transcriptional regulator